MFRRHERGHLPERRLLGTEPALVGADPGDHAPAQPQVGPQIHVDWGAVLPPPSKGGEVRVATIHRYKGLEASVVVLCEIDGEVVGCGALNDGGERVL